MVDGETSLCLDLLSRYEFLEGLKARTLQRCLDFGCLESLMVGIC